MASADLVIRGTVLTVDDTQPMPGLIEAHGHPLLEAVVLSDWMVDIRPVTVRSADDVLAAVVDEVARRGTAGAYLFGWDPLLQAGLPEPTLTGCGWNTSRPCGPTRHAAQPRWGSP